MSTDTPWLDRIAHDLRGPLSPVQTAITLLRMGELEPARQAELLEMIDRQTRQLSRMIGELGDWSRAAQGTLLGERMTCSAAAVIEDRCGGVDIHGDEWRLCQLLRILMDHACARGRDPCLSMRREGEALDIVVAATMADEMRPTLLTEPSPEPYDGGLGLNLLIARAIAEAHGGTLAAEQGDDHVLRLRCTLPLAKA